MVGFLREVGDGEGIEAEAGLVSGEGEVDVLAWMEVSTGEMGGGVCEGNGEGEEVVCEGNVGEGCRGNFCEGDVTLDN